MEEKTMARIINLRDYYPWYIQNEYIEVSDGVAAELLADKRYQKTHQRIVRRHKVHSIDADDGTMTAASVHFTNNPETLFEMMGQHCRLCQALNSLPEIQGRRIEAHYLLDKSQQEIADAEGVTKGSVCISIKRGLAAMKIFLKNFDEQSNFCSKTVLINER